MKKYKFIILLIPRARSLKSFSGDFGPEITKSFFDTWEKQFDKFDFKKFSDREDGAYLIKEMTLDKKKTLGRKLKREFHSHKTKWIFWDKAAPEVLAKLSLARLTT